MALTVTNTNTLMLLNILDRNTKAQSSTLQMMATGRRINSAKDDPAGLVAFSFLNSELTAIKESLKNNQRSDSFLSVMDASIAEIGSLLGEIERLVAATSSDATLTASEISANQSQIDDALTAIDRIVSTANFNGKKLLDGTFGIQTAGVQTNSNVSNLRVFSRSRLTTDTMVTVTRVASAQVASATFAFAAGTARTSGSTQVAITGTLGTATLTLASGLTQAQVVTEINNVAGQTGVSAIQGSTNVSLNSTTFGTDAFVSVEVLSGGTINSSYGTATSDGDTNNDIQNASKQIGIDADITINGQSTGTDGLDVSYSANGLSFEFTLGTDFGTGNTGATTTTSFTVMASGGATFQLGTTNSTRQTIGLDSLATFKLGGGNGTVQLSALKAGGSAALKTNTEAALSSVRDAIGSVAGIRGRLGGFQKFQVGSAINALQAAQTGLTKAASVIMDTDFALATSKLNREQILIQSGIQLLGIANQQAAQILSLL